MKTACPAGILWITLCAVLAAEDAHQKIVLDAASKLAGRSGYSWVSTSQAAEGTENLRQGPTHGVTQLNGLTYVTFALGESTIEMAFHGDKAAIKWEDRWRGLNDLTGEDAWIAERLKSYLFAAQEAGFLATHSLNLKQTAEDTFSGDLKPQAITTLLSRGRRTVHEAPDMTGTVQFRIADGSITRYEFTLRGRRSLGEDQREIVMDRTTVVEIKDVGSDKIAVPGEAIKKLQ
jgi:hypothetical protein